MPNPYITKNSKIPVTGPKAYIDGGEKKGGRTTLKVPSMGEKVVAKENTYQIGRLQGVRSTGSSSGAAQKGNGGVSGAVRGAVAGAAPTPPSVQEEIKRRVNTAAQSTTRPAAQSTSRPAVQETQSSAGVSIGGSTSGVPGTVKPDTAKPDTPKVEAPKAMSYEDYFKKVGGDVYESMVEKTIAARVQQAADAYKKQKEQAGVSYEDAARQAYINNMMSQRNLDQQLAVNGIYGGMADSQKIAMETNYQNEVADLERQYIDTLADLEQAITDARLAGDTQAAEQMASYKTAVQNQYANYLLQKDQQAANADQWQREYEAQLELQRQQAAQQAAADSARYEAAASRGSSSRYGSGGYDNGSLSASQVAEMQRFYNVDADGAWGPQSSAVTYGLTADEAWQAYQAAKSKTGGYGGGGGVNRVMTK